VAASSERMVAWNNSYRGAPPPWDIGRPQPPVVRIADAGGFHSPVLDAGCGTGENALLLASRGLEIVGVDGASVAIEKASSKARSRSVRATFLIADALDLGALGRSFASVLDCGLFHVFDDADRAAYVASLASVVEPNGVVHLLCFSDAEPWGGGPRRVSQAELRSAFVDGWSVRTIEPTRFETLIHNDGARAWHATIERNG
jgi:SAM-dependent methyltransferase